MDLSDEGLADRWEDDTSESSVDDSDDSDIVLEDEGDDSDDDSEEAGEAAPDPVESDESEDDDNVPAPLKGKSRAEIAQMFEQAQQFIDRQGNELGELRKAVESIQSQQQYDESPEIDYIETTADAIGAYRQALQLLDEGRISPDVVDEIIEVAHELDPATGRKMDRDFGMRLSRAEANARMEPIQQATREANVLRATTDMYREEADTAAYQQDIARILRQPQTLEEHQLSSLYENAQTVSDIKAILAASVRLARGADPTRSSLYSSQLKERKKNERTEGGNATRSRSTQLSEVDQIREEAMSRKRSDVDLFKGFGS